MAKYKPAGSKKAKPSAGVAGKGGLIPCAIIILIGIVGISLLFYYSLQSGQ